MLRSRTNSILSIKQKRKQQHKQILGKSHNALIGNDVNWIDRFAEISQHLCFGDYDKCWFEDVHCDILRDLCNDQLPVDYVVHLLTLLELLGPLFDSEDKIEQTLGSLVNIIAQDETEQQTKWPPLVLNKYLYTTTNIMLCNLDWRFKSESINELYHSFVTILVEKTQLTKSVLHQTSLNCLNEIAILCSELINQVKCTANIKSTPTDMLYCVPLYIAQPRIGNLKKLVQQTRHQSQLNCYHMCVHLLELIESGQEQSWLTVITLKPFLHRFISSNSIHCLSFALKLLIKFGFEVFSSLEEEYFIKQLVVLCTLPSLPIGYRLMCLSFVRTAFTFIYKPPLNTPSISLIDSLYPYPNDGPDTQEKKLSILSEFSFAIPDKEYFKLLSGLHKLADSKNANHKRATISMFRVLHISLQKRPQIEDGLLQFLLENIFCSNYAHYAERLVTFLSRHWEFAQAFIDKFIAKLMILLKDQEQCEGHQSSSFTVGEKTLQPLLGSYRHYRSLLQLINWFLSVAHHHIGLTEFQLEFLIHFIRAHCLQWPESSTLALTCCTSILYYQRVTPKVKEALLFILEWLKNEHKMDIETSSLSQIYLLALRTLKEEYIKQVFTSDEEEFLIQKSLPENYDTYLCSIVKSQFESPLRVQRVPARENVKNKQQLSSDMSFPLAFEVYLVEESSLDRVFCVKLAFTSPQVEQLKRTFRLPLIKRNERNTSNRVVLHLDFKVNSPFWLNIVIKFVDFKGVIYNCKPQSEFIPLEESFIPLQVKSSQWLHEVCATVLSHPEAFQTVIGVRHHHSLDSFLGQYHWLQNFLIDDGDLRKDEDNSLSFVIGLSPDRLLLGRARVVNNFVNLYITTNHYSIIPCLVLHTFAC